MLHLPRIAIGTIQPEVDRQPMLWALLDVIERYGPSVQTFFSQARFVCHQGAVSITGETSRHLDSWLMSSEVCREIFQHGVGSSDYAIVGGEYDSALPQQTPRGGSLDTLCTWLDLARVVILDATKLRDCRLPARPDLADAILLDGVRDSEQACQLQTTIEALWGIPVLGSMELMPVLRGRIADLPPASCPARGLCRALGEKLQRSLKLERLVQLSQRPDLTPIKPQLFQNLKEGAPLHVAVAFDEAFNCYFPDTLDALENRGAVIRDFSPLKGESLPPKTDLVYLGCGNIENHIGKLADNHCFKQALRCHVAAGGRVYAEGSGLAYLCQNIVLPEGRRVPMAGVLQADASLDPMPGTPEPAQAILRRNSWLGPASSPLRGYLNTHWRIEPFGPVTRLAAEPKHWDNLFAYKNVFGSRIHLNFAAQADLLSNFFQPYQTAQLRSALH